MLLLLDSMRSRCQADEQESQEQNPQDVRCVKMDGRERLPRRFVCMGPVFLPRVVQMASTREPPPPPPAPLHCTNTSESS